MHTDRKTNRQTNRETVRKKGLQISVLGSEQGFVLDRAVQRIPERTNVLYL